MKNNSTHKNAFPVHQIEELFNKALVKRQGLNTNALRVINGEGDGLPGITLDRYNKHYVLQVFDDALENRADYIGRRILELVDAEYFIVKLRCWSDGLSLEDAPATILQGESSATVVTENGIDFNIDLHDAINSGLFLDMRSNRALVTAHAKGKRLLNGFSYTCSFGAYAKFYGALETVNVDISQKILSLGIENYKRNNLPYSEKEFIRADVMEYFDGLIKIGSVFDIIVMDPPSFSRHKGKTFSAKKSIGDIAQKSLKLLSDAGELFISTNNSSISKNVLKNIVTQEAAKEGIKLVSLKTVGQDIDFPGSGKVKESHLSGVWAKISKI